MQLNSQNITAAGEERISSSDVSILAIIAGSAKLRQQFSKLKTDPIFCALMNSILNTFVPTAQIRKIAECGKEIDILRPGSMVYDSKNCTKGVWFVLVAGKLKISKYDEEPAENNAQYEIYPGEIFGGYGIAGSHKNSDLVHVRIEALQASKLIEIGKTNIADLNAQQEVFAKLMSMMAG